MKCFGSAAIVLELLSQLGHVRVDGPREHDGAMVPDFAQQLDARGDRALAFTSAIIARRPSALG